MLGHFKGGMPALLLPHLKLQWVVGLLGLLGLLVSPCSFSALAENFGVGSAKALALGHAVTADPPGIDSIHFNPAGLAKLKGRQYQIKIIYPDITMDATIYAPDNSQKATLPDGSQMGMFDFLCGRGLNRPFRDPVFYDDRYGSSAEQRFADDCANGTPASPVHSEAGAAIYLPGVELQSIDSALGAAGGASYNPPGSRFTFGTTAYMREGNMMAREPNDPARYEGEAMGMVRLTYFSPTIAFEVDDHWSVGAGIHFSWQGMAMRLPLRVAHLGLAVIGSFQNVLCEIGPGNVLTPKPGAEGIYDVADICGGYFDPYTEAGALELEADEAFSTSFFIGVLWEPTLWFSVGAVYTPEVRDTLEGDFTFDYSDNWTGLFRGMNESGLFSTNIDNERFGIPYGHDIEQGKAEVEFITPAHFSIGFALQITPSIQFNMDAKWTDYDAWDTLPVKLTTNDTEGVDLLRFLNQVTPYASLDTLSLPFLFESVWNLAFGLRYTYSDRLELRLGYEPRKSSIPKNRYSLFAPFGEADLYGTGFAYQWDRDTEIEFALSYLHSEITIPANSSTLVNSTDPMEFVINPYAGSDIKGEVNAWIMSLGINGKF